MGHPPSGSKPSEAAARGVHLAVARGMYVVPGVGGWRDLLLFMWKRFSWGWLKLHPLLLELGEQ